MNRAIHLLAAAASTVASVAFGATVQLTGESPLRARLLAELVAAGFENCGRDCVLADAVVELDAEASVITFGDAATMRAPLHDGNDCVRIAERVRAKLLPLLPELRRVERATSPVVVNALVAKVPIVQKDNRSGSLPKARIELALGPSLAWQGGSTVVDLSVRARWMPWDRIGVGLSVNAPLVASQLRGAEGDAHAFAWLIGGEAMVRPFVFRHVHVGMGGGVYAARLTVTGEGKAPYLSSSSSVWVAVPYGFVEVALRIGSHWSVPMTASIGFASPPLDIRFAGRVVDPWASPMVRVSIGVQYAF